MANATSTSTTLVEGGIDGLGEPQLCHRCAELDLAVDKFILDSSSSDIPFYSTVKRQIQDTFQLKSGYIRKDFAKLQQLRENSEDCRFCELLHKAIRRFSPPSVSDDVVCSLSWELDGRKIDSGGFVNSTRRIRLSWSGVVQTNHDSNGTHEVYLVFVAPRDPSRPNSDAMIKSSHESHFLGRELGDQKENQALLRSWLDLCVEEHTESCVDTHTGEAKFIELISETYFGVIDVLDMQLKALPILKGKPARYAALSYVWGRSRHDEPPYVTTRENVLTHILHGGLETAWDRLPRTIQDAILLVSRLGERYLWIDSLCIVQDSESSWLLNSQAMHLVYGHAYFTICAADGDASAGLQAARSIIQPAYPAALSSIANLSIVTSGSTKEPNNSQSLSADYRPGVRVMVTRPLEAVVNDSLWNKRAWTFQERILSRRCLIFAEGRVYYQCRSTTISQDIYAGSKGLGWSLDQATSPLQTLQELENRPFWFYIKHVNMYTGRNLTKPKDILAAFEGISQLFDRYTKAPSLYGLPTSHFDIALLWSSSTTLRRRRASIANPNMKGRCTQDDMGNCICGSEEDAFGGTEFPSWAWSGWMGGPVEYQFKMLDGCFTHTLSFLCFHTWIQWHVRDEKGHLRPLWEMATRRPSKKNHSEEDGEQDENENENGSDQLSSENDFSESEKSVNRFGWMGYPGHSLDNGSDSDSSDSISRVDEMSIASSDKPVKSRKEKRRKQKAPRIERVSNTNYLHHASHASNWNRRHSSYYKRRPRKWVGSQALETIRRDWVNPALSYLKSTSAFVQPEPEPSSSESEATRSSRNGKGKKKAKAKAKTKKSHVSDIFKTSGSDASGSEGSSGSENNEEATGKGPSTYKDKYGRRISASIPKKLPPFQAILPDNPFGVIREKESRGSISGVQYRPILQFFTWRTDLIVSTRKTTPQESSQKASSCLNYFDIADIDRDWCGSIKLPNDWMGEQQGGMFTFIAISDAKAFTEDECPVWTYYIPKERDESEWDLYFVLLLERNKERGVWERVGLGKVFQPAFRQGTWDEIKLG